MTHSPNPSTPDVVVAKLKKWAVPACDTPVFLLRVPRGESREPVHYLVLAHWEYDPEQATTQEQLEDCATVAAQFNALASIGAETRIESATRLAGLSVTGRPCTTRPGC